MNDNFHVKDVDRDTFTHRGIEDEPEFNVIVRQNPEVVQYAANATAADGNDRTLNILTPLTIDWDVEFAHPVGTLIFDHADTIIEDECTAS